MRTTVIFDPDVQRPAARVIAPTERHAGLLASLLLGAGHGGNLVSDAHLARAGHRTQRELGTFDRDFERFAGLRVVRLK